MEKHPVSKEEAQILLIVLIIFVIFLVVIGVTFTVALWIGIVVIEGVRLRGVCKKKE